MSANPSAVPTSRPGENAIRAPFAAMADVRALVGDAAADALPTLANAENCYPVTRADLPLSCPMPSMSLWNSHPRVYMPILEQGGHSRCPYCGARFDLID